MSSGRLSMQSAVATTRYHTSSGRSGWLRSVSSSSGVMIEGCWAVIFTQIRLFSVFFSEEAVSQDNQRGLENGSWRC